MQKWYKFRVLHVFCGRRVSLMRMDEVHLTQIPDGFHLRIASTPKNSSRTGFLSMVTHLKMTTSVRNISCILLKNLSFLLNFLFSHRKRARPKIYTLSRTKTIRYPEERREEQKTLIEKRDSICKNLSIV